MKAIDNRNSPYARWAAWCKPAAISCLLIVAYLAAAATFSPAAADPSDLARGPSGPAVVPSLSANSSHPLFSPQGAPTTWRDTFDDGSGLEVQKNTQVRQGTLTLGLDDTWVQTTQEDFEADTLDTTLDTTSAPGTLRLAKVITFTANVRVDDDTGPAWQFSPAIAVDGDGNAYAVWADKRNGNEDIYFSRSTDGGVTWGPNVRVNDDAGSVDQSSPAIAVDGDSNAYAVWQDERNDNWDIYFSRSTDGGVTWSPNVRVNDDTGSVGQGYLAIAVDGDSNAYAVWQDERNGGSDIYFSRSMDGGVTWSPNVRVDDDTGLASQYDPAIAVDGDGHAYAVWRDHRNSGSDIYFSRSMDGGVTWSPNVRVNDDTGSAGQSYHAITVDGDGNAYVVWQDERSGNWDIYFSRSTNGGETWSPDVRVSDDTGSANQDDPAIAVDANGNAYAVWQDYRNGGSDIYFSHSADGGATWSPNVRVDDTGFAGQGSPAIAVDGRGNAYAVWWDERNGDYDIYFARSLPGMTYFSAGTWTSTVYDAGDVVAWEDIAWAAITPVRTAIAFQTRTGDTPTPDHTWSDWSDVYTVLGEAIASPAARYIQCRATLSTSDVYTTPVLLEVRIHYRPHLWTQTTQADFESGTADRLDVASAPGDVILVQAPAFGANVKVNDDSGLATQRYPAIAVNGDGHAYAVWQDARSSFYDIYFSRSTDGGVTWSPNVRVDNNTVSAYQSSPAIAVDGDGHAYAVWQDHRNGPNGDIYFSRSTDGGTTWSPDVRVNDDVGSTCRWSPAIAVDASGDAYVVWEDSPVCPYRDIYFSRSTDGGTTWSPNVRVNDDTGSASQHLPAIAVDANGHAYAVWTDERNGSWDIYSSRSTDGGVTWSPNVRVNDDVGSATQWGPAIAVDRDGNVYAVWYGVRNGYYGDIYFSRSTDGGTTWSPNVRVNDDVGLADQYSPAIAVGGDGHAYAVWYDGRNGNWDIYFSHSTDGGVTWSPNVLINDDTGSASQHFPAIAVDGNVYAVWWDERNDNDDIYFARSLPGITLTYANIGTLTSSVHDSAGVVAWGQITWTVSTPPSTTVTFQTRTGDTATPDGNWSQWSTVYPSPGLTVTSLLSRYLQYQAVLSTTDPYTTPVLHNVTMDWKQFAPSGSATSVPITPPPGFLRWDNLYFTVDVPGNTSLTVDVLSINGTVLMSNVASGVSLYSIDPVVHPAIRLRANLVRSTDPTQTPRLDEWMVTWYPLPPDQHVRVFDEGGTPVVGARVYQNGNLIGSTDDLGVFGFHPPTHTLSIDDRLVALALVDERQSFREAHQTWDSAQNWAFRTYVTNMEVPEEGDPYTHVVTQTGRQLLTVKESNPLVFFNLLVSIEWDATDEYMGEIARAVQSASDYLYDLTDGQMAFGRVDIYDNGEHWANADIQISTKNIVRPHAYIGGITSEDTSHVIRVGRGWDGTSGNQGPWDQPDGFRTLGHEFGHYALYLYDEYFAYVFDQNGNLTGEVPAYCTGPENRNPATDDINASVMDYQYTSSELSAYGVPGLWSPLCEQTAQWQLTERQLGHGESPWETLTRMYTDTISPPRWQLTTPADRGSVLAGPTGLPTDVLALPTVTTINSGASGPGRQLTVYGPDGEGYWGAIVALYKQDGSGRVIGQGFTDGNGRLDIYGADEGDILRAASMDGGLAGSVTVGTETSLTLFLAPVGGLAAQATGGIPHMRVVAEPSQDPAQIDLLVFLQNFGPGADPSVIVTEPGSEAGYAPTLSYSPSTDTYEGQINFSATERGMGRIRAVGAVGDHLVRLQSTYRLQRVLNNQSHDVYSDDGNLGLHLEPGSLPGNEAYFVVMPPGAVPGSLPDGLVLVGDPYDVSASGALVTLEEPAILTLRYDGALVNEPSAPEGLGIYRWAPNSETWQAVAGSLDEEQRAMVASVTTLGMYALMAPPGEWEPSQNFLPLILKGVP